MEPGICLTNAEWKVMEQLWETSPRTITQMVSALKESTGWSKSTVIKLLERMEAKDAVYYREGGRARLYYPAIPREEAALQETETFLQKVFGGEVSRMVNTMAERQVLTQKEIDELYAVLEKARQKL